MKTGGKIMKDILVRNVPLRDHERFRFACKARDTDMSKVLRRAIREFIEATSGRERQHGRG